MCQQLVYDLLTCFTVLLGGARGGRKDDARARQGAAADGDAESDSLADGSSLTTRRR